MIHKAVSCSKVCMFQDFHRKLVQLQHSDNVQIHCGLSNVCELASRTLPRRVPKVGPGNSCHCRTFRPCRYMSLRYTVGSIDSGPRNRTSAMKRNEMALYRIKVNHLEIICYFIAFGGRLLVGYVYALEPSSRKLWSFRKRFQVC